MASVLFNQHGAAFNQRVAGSIPARLTTFFSGMTLVRCLAKLALSSWLLCFCLTTTTVANERLVVLPFENVSSKREYNWLGEGLALALSDWLSVPGVDVVTPEERQAAFTLLSFSETAILSRASAIRVAQEVGTDLLLVGTYKVMGPRGKEQVTLSVLSIEVAAGRLAQNPLEAGAALSELLELQGILAWDILLSRGVPLTVSRNQFLSRLRAIPPRTFQLYVKAGLAKDLSTKAELLRLALKQRDQVKSDTTFFPGAYELGKVYYLQQNYAAAIPWLSQPKPGGLYYRDAQFYLGLCYEALGDLDKAMSVFTDLSRTVPTASVFNNLAVIELKRGQVAKAVDYLTIALATDGDNPDIWFNSGYAYWLNGAYEMATIKFREALHRQIKDGEAHYLLAKTYAQLGRPELAKVTLEEARKYLPTVTQWERSGQVPMLARVVKNLNRLGWLRSGDRQPPNETGARPSSQSAWRDRVLAVAEQLTAQNKDQEALELLEAFLRQTPNSAPAHLLKARIHEGMKDYATAIAELRAATFWDPQLVPAYVNLGRVYVTLGETGRAWESVQKALALEPRNEEALALQQLLRRSPDR